MSPEENYNATYSFGVASNAWGYNVDKEIVVVNSKVKYYKYRYSNLPGLMSTTQGNVIEKEYFSDKGWIISGNDTKYNDTEYEEINEEFQKRKLIQEISATLEQTNITKEISDGNIICFGWGESASYRQHKICFDKNGRFIEWNKGFFHGGEWWVKTT